MPGKEDLIKIHRFLAGEMDPAERMSFEEALSVDEALRKQFEEVSYVWSAANHYTTPEFDASGAFSATRLRLQRRPSRRRFWRYAAAASILLLMGFWGVSLLFNQSGMHHVYASSDMEIRLDDGSVMELRKGASVVYPEHFGKKSRAVDIKHGQVYFKIEKDPQRPFRVKHKWADVRVTGTEFVISIDTIDQSYTVQVTEGSVRLEPGLSSEKIDVTAGAGYRFHADTRKINVLTLVDSNAISWVTGELSFRNTPLEKVVADIASHYQLEIELRESQARHCKFTAPLPYRNVPVTTILDALSGTFGIDITSVDDHRYVLTGGSCK